MTRTEKLTYTQGLESRIVELEDQVQRQAARILVLAGVDPTKQGFTPTGGVPFGTQRMAASMRLPTTTKSVPPALAAQSLAATPKGKLPAGIRRMAETMRLPS